MAVLKTRVTHTLDTAAQANGTHHAEPFIAELHKTVPAEVDPAGQYTPVGHATPALEPEGQYDPGGHTS